MANIQAYDDMIGALGKFYRETGIVNNELLIQTRDMQIAMDDDYAEELCEQVGSFISRINLLLDDVIEIQRALADRMTEIFE